MPKGIRHTTHFEPKRRSDTVNSLHIPKTHRTFAEAVKAVTSSPLLVGKKGAHKLAISLSWFKRRKVVNIGMSALVIVGLIVGILLPMATVQASETLNWSTNADFAMNKTSKCQSVTNSNIIISGPAYTDATCATGEADSSVSLARDIYRVRDVQSMSAGPRYSVVSKGDGTVWAWGENQNGQIGNGESGAVNIAKPSQVKGVDGVGFLTDVKKVAAGEAVVVALKNDGTVFVWGNGQMSQRGDGGSGITTTPVQVRVSAGGPFLTDVVSIAVGVRHTAIVKSDGTVWTWGSNTYGNLGDATGSVRPYPVQVKINSTNNFLTNVKSVEIGDESTFAIKNDGSVWAWGRNNNGHLGVSATDVNNRLTAFPVLGAGGSGFLTDVKSVSVGDSHMLAVKNDGTLWAAGLNSSGQLGAGVSETSLYTIVQVQGVNGEGFLTDVAFADVSDAASFAVKSNGTAYSWGSGSSGQLGNNSTNGSLVPAPIKGLSGQGVLGGVTDIETGIAFVMARDQDNSVVAWGENLRSQLAYRSPGSSTMVPNHIILKVDTTEFTDAKTVAVGDGHTVGLKNDGTVWAWGQNTYGQVGDGTKIDTPSPVRVSNADGSGYLADVAKVYASGNSTFALKNDGTVWAWGSNSVGQLGSGPGTDNPRPQQVRVAVGGFLTDVKQMSFTASHGLAVKNDGTVWAWGSNDAGRLGNGVSGSSFPGAVQVKSADGTGFLIDVKQVSAGGAHSMAVKNDGTVWAWGQNPSGQLGDNTLIESNLPRQVKSSDGASFLVNISAISIGDRSSYALGNNGTVWAWGYNTQANLGDGTVVRRTLPVQVKDAAGTGFLNDVKEIYAVSNTGYAIKNDGTIWGWGRNAYSELTDGTSTDRSLPVQIKGLGGIGFLTNVKDFAGGIYNKAVITSNNSYVVWGSSTQNIGYDTLGTFSNATYPRVMIASYSFNAGYAIDGNLSNIIVDAGAGKKRQWNTVDWTSAALPVNTKISFAARTSNDGTVWSVWTPEVVQSTVGSVSGSGVIASAPISRFIELKPRLQSTDQVTTPTLTDFSLTYVNDILAPSTNASVVQMRKTPGGAAITADSWTNAATPYLSWTAGADNIGGLGLSGYCAYLGHDANADVQQTKGLLGTSPTALEGAGCQYVTADTNINTAVNALSAQLTSSNDPYYLLVKAIDKAGNVFAGPAASYSFKFDNTPPTTPAFISAPSQFVASKDVTLTWPTAGGQSATDANSGLAGLQYKVGTNGTWYGDDHTGTQDITDVLANDGSYATDPTRDYPLLNEGNNIVYFRTIDNAGNVSSSNNTAAIKINTTSPTPPQSLTATPSTNTTNAFAFTWSAPSSFVGPANALTYCYTVNTLPTANTCTFTPAGQANLATDAYATQPGENILYVVAKDEAGNVNYDTYATVTFSANTPAPGIPVGTEIADISTKATQTWKLALSWAAPSTVGAGVSKYAVYRSTNGVTFSQIATTSGLSYVDSDLDQELYYYKIRACDSANNCGAFSDVFSRTPTGRFTSPPELVTGPSVQVSTKKASFSYVTDRNSDSRIQYGVKSGEYFPGEVAVSASTKNHKVEISNLDAGTTYFYKAKWTDEDGNTGTTTELSFTTLPAPSIKNVSVIKTTLTSATIQFTAVDASQVNIAYGKTDGFGGLETINTSRSESTYTVELNGLDDGSTYFYKFSTFDSDENEYDSRRADSFTTPPRPRISDLRFQPVVGEATSTQKVTWKTNVPASSTVSYGKIGDSPRDVYDARTTTDHEVLINNLDDASEYALLAQSRDTSGNLATSDRQTFRTALDTRAPKISDVQIESLVKGSGSEARGQIVVSWKTDEPATSQIGYAQGSNGKNYTSQTAEDTRLTTEHVVIVSDLSVSSVYHLQPISRDKSSNTASGDDKSAIIGRATDSVLNIILSTLNKIFGL